jgi:hypothetical protein
VVLEASIRAKMNFYTPTRCSRLRCVNAGKLQYRESGSKSFEIYKFDKVSDFKFVLISEGAGGIRN